MPGYRPQSYRLREREAFVVYGIPFDDAETAILARRVVLISSLMSMFAFVAAILSLITGWFWGSFIWVGLIIPLCGYCGTLSRSRTTVSCFAVSGLIMGIVYIAAIVSTLAVLGDWVTCACDPQCRIDAHIPTSDADKVCSDPGTFRVLFWVSVAFAIGMCVLLCAGSVYGFQLASKPHFEDVNVEVVYATPVTTTYVVQPPPGGYVVPMTHGVYSPQPVPAHYRAYATPQPQYQQQFTYATGPGGQPQPYQAGYPPQPPHGAGPAGQAPAGAGAPPTSPRKPPS